MQDDTGTAPSAILTSRKKQTKREIIKYAGKNRELKVKTKRNMFEKNAYFQNGTLFR